jgi:uncharacterized protein (DUF433 family)
MEAVLRAIRWARRPELSQETRALKESDFRFDRVLYSIPEAARLARLPQRTLWNWVRGYAYPAGGLMVHAPPVIAPPQSDPVGLSFVNLVEAVALAGFREAGVSMQKVRRALRYAAEGMGTEHPLATQRIFTDGVDLFWEYEHEEAPDDIQLVNITRGGQKAFPEAVMRYLREMEWGRDQLVIRWWPGSLEPGKGIVVLDPRRGFGAPVVAGTGIRTDDLFDRFSAGESLQELVDDYGLSIAQIEEAIRLELKFREPVAA